MAGDIIVTRAQIAAGQRPARAAMSVPEEADSLEQVDARPIALVRKVRTSERLLDQY
jgi:hypothetical protein